jgi:4-amino-4-deoxy-L-arabinose transferase-like glycosyltransferase
LGLGGIRPELPGILRAFTLDARLMTVLVALVTVGAAYGAATRLTGRRAGLVAAAIVAFAPGHVLYSHFAAVDVPLACCMALAAWAAVVLLDDRRWRIVALAGLACGASAATKYNGALVLVAPLLALAIWLWRSPRPRPWRAALLRGAAMVLIAAVAFALLSPYVFLDWSKASRDIAFEMRHMREGEYPAKAADPCGWYFQARALAYALGGPVPLLGSVALFVVGVRATWPRSLPLILLALAWYLMIGGTGVRYARYGLPLVPLLAVGAACALEAALGSAPRLRALLHAVTAACLLLALGASACLSGSMALSPDPRDAAFSNLDRTVLPSETVGVARTIWFDMPPLDHVNGGDVLGRRFATLSRPVRPLRVVPNFDAAQLRRERLPWFVETDFQTAEWLRAGNPAAREFRRALQAHYTLHGTHARRVAWPPTARWGPVPHDFSYPFTRVRIWRLKPSEDAPAGD